MSSVLLAPNVLIAATGAIGVLLVVWSLVLRPGIDLQRADVVEGRVRPRPSWLDRLDQRLRQAEWGVTAGEFIRTTTLLGVAAGLLAWLVSGAPIAGLAAVFIGGSAYATYLSDRRDKKRADFQDALADTVGLLIEGIQSGHALEPALKYVADHGPAIVRQDFAETLTLINTGKTREQALTALADRRRDPILDVIVETLLVQVKESNADIEILDPLRGLQESVRARVAIRTRIRAEQESPKWEVRITTIFVFLMLFFARLTNPSYSDFWRTPLGGLSLLVALTLACVGYAWASRVIASGTRIEESFGVVAFESREPPRPTGRVEMEQEA